MPAIRMPSEKNSTDCSRIDQALDHRWVLGAIIRVRPRYGVAASGGGARSDFRRKKTAGLTDRVGPPVSEGEATARLGREGREEMGRG